MSLLHHSAAGHAIAERVALENIVNHASGVMRRVASMHGTADSLALQVEAVRGEPDRMHADA